MKDFNGNEVKTGDILLELNRGYGSLSGSKYIYHIKLWEIPNNFDGHGYYYHIDGSKHLYAWAHVKNSILVNMSLMPEGFEYSFKHGMSDISSKIYEGSLESIIEQSNWKDCLVEQKEVEQFKFMETLEINSIEDIKNNIEHLKGGYIPGHIVTKVLELGRIGNAPVHNGEIGISSMYDQLNYQAIISVIEAN